MATLVSQTKRVPVALDAMGGDVGVSVNVAGAVESVRLDGANVILVGDESLVRAELEARQGAGLLDNGRVVIRHAPEVVDMDEKPGVALRKKKQSSMRVTCDLVKSGEAGAALSAGNSGAMMAVALFVIGRIPGVMRPCIATVFPSRHPSGMSLLLDAGANVDCTPEHLVQFAIMADVYTRQQFGEESPSLGLIANGSEETKGTDLTRAAFRLLSQTDLNFVGYIESNCLSRGEPRIAVTDGFTGNIILKTAEGAQQFVTQQLKAGYVHGGILAKLGGLLSKPMFNALKEKFDPREYGAAPLLGLSAPAYIAHGKSDAFAIRRAVTLASQCSPDLLTKKISENISKWSSLLEKEREPDGVAS